jgi:SAM-dependent methyltransferase
MFGSKFFILSDMQPYFKTNLQHQLETAAPVIVELGCGPTKTPGRIGIDRLDFPCVDIVGDVYASLKAFPDACVDEIYSKSLLEHVDDLGAVVKEIVRVLKPNGRKIAFVPHFSNPHYYSDYTHTKFIGLYTFYYFVNPKYQLRRKVPVFYSDVRIRILSQKIIFRSSFKLIRVFKKLFQKLVNFNTWTQEFYEENLCYLIPCYGLEIEFIPDTQPSD